MVVRQHSSSPYTHDIVWRGHVSQQRVEQDDGLPLLRCSLRLRSTQGPSTGFSDLLPGPKAVPVDHDGSINRQPFPALSTLADHYSMLYLGLSIPAKNPQCTGDSNKVQVHSPSISHIPGCRSRAVLIGAHHLYEVEDDGRGHDILGRNQYVKVAVVQLVRVHVPKAHEVQSLTPVHVVHDPPHP